MLKLNDEYTSFQEDGALSTENQDAAAAAEDSNAIEIQQQATEDAEAAEVNNNNGQLPPSQQATVDTTPNSAAETGSGGRWRCLRVVRSSLWTNIPFIAYCIVVAAVQGCIQSVLIFLPARGRELGSNPSGAALLLTLFGAFDMAGRFIFGFVFDIRAVRRRRRSVRYSS